jgi:hypothetical protein
LQFIDEELLQSMTLTAATILLYLAALFLTGATLWPFSYAISPKQTDPRDFLVLIGVVVPFVMVIYFGFAFLIDDTISEGAAWLTAEEKELSFTEGLVAAVSYVGLSGWLWLRWRNLIGSGILGPAIIAAAIIFLIVGVTWAAHHDASGGKISMKTAVAGSEISS